MLTLYNSLSKKKEPFTSITPHTVTLYTCGPTVYNFVHIGNLRTYVFEDILRRTLKHAQYHVEHVMNITDVGHLTDDADQGEDKMEKGSKREGKTAWELADFYTDAFKKDIADLHILEPTTWCKATDYIKEQIDMVQTLIDKGFAYQTQDGIYFDTTKVNDYGKLVDLDKQSLQAGARVDLGEKKNPHDFALWKFSPEGEKRQMEWNAFGKKGFPGWHIECSAMSTHFFGEHFDIHCGGVDHKPVHHTNEIAQTEAATGKKPWVNFWVHGEFLVILNGEKMAKSGDNFITLETLKKNNIHPLSYRYFLLQAHYRKQLQFSWEALQAAQQGLQKLYALVDQLDDHVVSDPLVVESFFGAVLDDLNTPEALAILWTGLKEKTISIEDIVEMDKILGLKLHDPKRRHLDIPENVQELLEQRKKAREEKDWTKSDQLRDEIISLGYTLEDTATGQHISKQFHTHE